MRFCTLHEKNSGPLAADLQLLRESSAWEQKIKYLRDDTDHCMCYLSVDIEGESEYVSNRAIEMGDDVVNVLNLFLSFSRRHSKTYARIGVLGQAAISHRAITFKRRPPVGNEEQEPSFSYRMSNPPIRRYEIESDDINNWRENGLVKILTCIVATEPELGSAEARIRNAVTWFGRALRGESISEQFVGLSIALESLLVGEENLNITQRLADGVSFLLGLDFSHRGEIGKRVRYLYNVRSKIVHAGIPASDQSLFSLEEIVANTIISFVKNEGR